MRRALLVLCGLCAIARADDELSQWLLELESQPLDLRSVDVEELARLPWLDRVQAEAIIGLRESGALSELEDLARAGIVDPPTLRAIEPFVEWQVAERSLRWRADLSSAWLREGGPPRQRQSLDLRAGRWSGWLREDGHGALGLRLGRTQIALGQTRLRHERELLAVADASQSRSAPLAAPRSLQLGSDRAALQTRFALLHGEALALSLDDQVALLFLRRAALGAGLRLSRAGAPLLQLGLAGAGFDLQWLGEGSRASLLVASARRARGPWQLGLDFARSAQAFTATRDPLSGRLLDRPHSAQQLHLRWRGDVHSTLLMARRLERGLPAAARERQLRLLLESSLRASGWSLRWRSTLDRDFGESPQFRCSLRLVRPLLGGARQTLELRWQPTGGEDSRLYALGLAGGREWAWQLVLSQSDGERSAFDARGLAGAARSQWLAAGAQRLAASLQWRGLALWLDSVRSPGATADLRTGIRLDLRLGAG